MGAPFSRPHAQGLTPGSRLAAIAAAPPRARIEAAPLGGAPTLAPPLVAVAKPAGDSLLRVDVGDTRQIFEGWGTSLAWWANVVGEWERGKWRVGCPFFSFDSQPTPHCAHSPGAFPDAIRTRVADLVFDPVKGLGLQIARYNIGGSGWATPDADTLRPGGNVDSFQGPDGSYDWSKDAAQRWMLLAAKERGANLFEAFSNSPPYWMTISGRASGAASASDDNLAPANYTAFADYLVNVVDHFRTDFNVTFRTLDPFNEPATDYWFAGNVQEGCHFDRASQSAFIPVLADALAQKGLTGVVEIAASDETSMADALESFEAYTPTAKSLISQVNTHAYWGRTYPRVALGPAGVLAAGRRLWQSEYGAGTAPPSDMTDGLTLASQAAADVNVLQAGAWVYWQAFENLDGKDPTPWWGLGQLSFDSGKGVRVGKQFWALAQYSKHVRAGATILASPAPASLVVALMPGGDKLVLVFTRAGPTDGAAAVDVSSFLGGRAGHATATRTSASEDGADAGDLALQREWGGRFDVRLSARSVTTVVITVA